MLKRTLDPTLFNQIANHPEVHPWLGQEGEINLEAPALNLDNYFLTDGENGGFAAIKIADGTYEVHTLFFPNGGEVLDVAKGAMDYMFTRTDCHTLVTQVPVKNKPAYVLATTVGFKPIFVREDAPCGPTRYTRFTIDEWIHSSTDLAKDGEWFHDKLEAAKKENGSELPTHPDDPAHDRAVGATVRMIRRGNAYKGVDYYNGWARFTGYAPIMMLNDNPIVIDVLDAVVEVKDGDMEIIKCR